MDESKTIEVAKGKGKKKGSGSGSTKYEKSGKSQSSSTSSSKKDETTTNIEMKVADDNEDTPPEKTPEKQDHSPYEGDIWRCLVCGMYFNSHAGLMLHNASHVTHD